MAIDNEGQFFFSDEVEARSFAKERGVDFSSFAKEEDNDGNPVFYTGIFEGEPEPMIVLDDGDTYASVEGCKVVFATKASIVEAEDCGKAKCLVGEEVSLAELVKFWQENHK